MKLVITKSYPTYTVATEMANGSIKQRYTFNVSNFAFTPIDTNRINMTKCGATMFYDKSAERYWHILNAYNSIAKSLYDNTSNLTAEVIQKIDLWVNAFPQEMEQLASRWGKIYSNNLITLFNDMPKPNAELMQAIMCYCKDNCSYTLYSIKSVFRDYMFVKQNKNTFYSEWLFDKRNRRFENSLQNVAVYFKNFKLPNALMRLFINNYYRWGLGERANINRGIAFLAFDMTINEIKRFINEIDSNDTVMINQIFQYLDTEINQKAELVQEVEKALLKFRIMKEKFKNEFLAQNVNKYLANKLNSERFTIKPLTSVDDYEKAGKEWHNCLGGWGLNNSLNRNAKNVHVVAEVTPKNEKTFIAGLYFDISCAKYSHCSYMVYDRNENINTCLKNEFETFLMNTCE